MSDRQDIYNTTVFAKRLKTRMELLQLTQKDLSERTGIQRQTISLYLKGKTAPASDKLVSLAIELNCSADWLLGLDNYPDRETARLTASDLCLHSDTVQALFEHAVPSALNLLFETTSFSNFLNTIWKYFNAKTAEYIANLVIRDLNIQNDRFPRNSEISLKLLEITSFPNMGDDTKDFLYYLSDRYEKSDNGNCIWPDEIDCSSVDGLKISEIYELQANKLFTKMIEALNETALEEASSEMYQQD